VQARPQAWLEDPLECGAAAGFGVYLHVPFCHHRCGYCDFATEAVGQRDPVERDRLERRYVAALVADLGRQAAAGPRGLATGVGGTGDPDRAPASWPSVTSVFVGGGTPTLLPPALLARILRAVRTELDVTSDVEVTVECNPETASAELFAVLVDEGVTRLSIGAQSFVPDVLATLERGHGPQAPLRAVELARAAGVPSISLDVIYGTPGEHAADWRHTLEQVLRCGVDHVSAYALTVHDNTSFGRQVAAGTLPAPDGDVQRAFFDVAREVLGAGGFQHYEVSNWSLGDGRRSRHNELYWRHGDYLGVGVGAHAHRAGRRWWTTRSTARYLEAVESVDASNTAAPWAWVAGSEELTVEQQADERLLLGLRLREGLHPRDLPPIDPLALEDALAAGLVETACGRLRCTDEGWFLLDEAVGRLAS